MKVYLRDEYDSRGACIGDVQPTRLMDVFEEVRNLSVYDERRSNYYSIFTHQIVVVDDQEAYFEIVMSHE